MTYQDQIKQLERLSITVRGLLKNHTIRQREIFIQKFLNKKGYKHLFIEDEKYLRDKKLNSIRVVMKGNRPTSVFIFYSRKHYVSITLNVPGYVFNHIFGSNLLNLN